MTERAVPSYAVAAAILLLDGPMHFRSLTHRVMETKLSGLGRTGKTPWQTLRSDMLKNHDRVFVAQGWRSGLYEIQDSEVALRDYSIKEALERLAIREIDRYRQLVVRTIRDEIDLFSSKEHRQSIESTEGRLSRCARIYTRPGQ